MTSLFPSSPSPSSSSSQPLDRVQDWLRASLDPALTASPLRPPTPPKPPATAPTPSLKRPRAAQVQAKDGANMMPLSPNEVHRELLVLFGLTVPF
ncbi:hypothetical protein PTNB85_07737 [Pyrenophora teres f. teres]|nr:hypothetical protein HRS9122_10096 [Pyrenophora teres f. teres]KAE8828550.1 hypothetical protein HRS9139_07769 [Pyrenophora teres f. teres]KAE8831150.1 hypothetical protein PTNB85_07737 [Pyrenophora teres f. teres]KAE8856849.1 hypothetical protein PTNB29_07916 [Pyrenophora teres f. teres]CAE7189373.1 hypothetical protein PTTW11_07467 [Pyrenophora teres f. teres]